MYAVRFTASHDVAASLRAARSDASTEPRTAEIAELELFILGELSLTTLDRMLADTSCRIIARR